MYYVYTNCIFILPCPVYYRSVATDHLYAAAASSGETVRHSTNVGGG